MNDFVTSRVYIDPIVFYSTANGSIERSLNDFSPTDFKIFKFENTAKMANFGSKSSPKFYEFACAIRVRGNQLKKSLYGIFSNLV